MDIEQQWKQWQDANPLDGLPDVDIDTLRNKLISDLTYVSQMDVREYTLYQKWCEIKRKYPLETRSTLFGDESVLVDNTQSVIIDNIKKNIWIPEDPEEYLTIKPRLIYTDDSQESTTTNAFGLETTSVKKRSKELPETWNTIRNFISTMKNNSNIGRNMNFIVQDEVSGKYLGVICISSDFLDLTPRDEWIGWSREVKTQGRMINYTAIGSTIVPFQPLGYNYVGGKLLALLCLSDTVQNTWKKEYGDVLVGVTTTSLYGKTKVGGLSQYDNLDHWLPMGFTSGSVSYDPSRDTVQMLRDYLKKNYTREYFEWYGATNDSGQPYKRDHKNRSQYFVYSKLGIPKDIIRSDHARGIYFSPLYDNSKEFLNKQCSESGLIKSFDTSEDALTEIWRNKHAKGRFKSLKKKGNLSSETLFYDDLIYLSWEDAKSKYLPQVGR